jgi:hypothetical protein
LINLGIALFDTSKTLTIPLSELTKTTFPSLLASRAVGFEKSLTLASYVPDVPSHTANDKSSLTVTTCVVSPSSFTPVIFLVWNLPSSTNGVSISFVSFWRF